VLNLALRHHDTWAVCAYDRRTLAADMVEDLYATHPWSGKTAATGATTGTDIRSTSSFGTATIQPTRSSGLRRLSSSSTRLRPPRAPP